MAPTPRTQSSCSTDAENNNPYPQGQTGLLRNRLGNRIRKPVLSEYRQNQIPAKPFLHPTRKPALHTDISKSAPDLSRPPKPLRTKIPSFGNSIHKLSSLDSLPKPRPKAPPPSRLPTNPAPPPPKHKPSNELKKPKRVEVAKKLILDTKRGQKQVDNKRKLAYMDVPAHPKQKIPGKELLSPTAFPSSLSPPKNRMEECSKIVKKIMLDKKMLEMGERKRSSGEFEDSIGTFDSDEMVDFLMNDSQLRHLETTRISADFDSKSSKRNSSEFEDSIGSFFSDQMVFNLSKSNEFLNAKHSPFGDNPDHLDNLTPSLSELSNALDRTPSAEDLPMECEPEPAAAPPPEPEAVSARSTSPELPQESLSSRTPNAPVSIITSITSIMSLDTGYQGDGELSRPESRNTEAESRPKLPVVDNGIPVKTINFDDGKTMTDSDFFTESDADVHDDLSAAAAEIGSGKGDRKAQVIDGTLYGGAFIQTQGGVRQGGDVQGGAPEHSAAMVGSSANEDMESSGIYSDLDRKPEEVQPAVSYLGLITEQMKTIQSLALLVAEREGRPEGIVKSSSAESSSTVQEVASVKKTGEKKGTEQGKKSKAPGRNVTSKIKALMEAPGSATEARRKTVKKGKWDAVMDKIAQGKEENKYTPSKFRDIKSKVFQNIGPLFNGRKNDAEANSPTSGQSKSRSRRSTRVRSSESSLVSPKSKLSRTSASPNSSQRSSLSDISLSANSHHKSASRPNKKRDSISPPSNDSTNPATTPTRKPNNNNDSTANGGTPCRNSDMQNGNVVRTPSATALGTMKTPTVRKTPTPRLGRNDAVGQSLQRTGSVPLKDSNHNGIVSKTGSTVIVNNNNNNSSTQNNNNNNKVKSAQSFQSKSLKVGTRAANPVQVKNGCLLTVAKETNKALLKQLKHNSKAFESLAILFAYCTDDLDAFSTPRLKQKLEAERSKVIQAQSDLEELQSRLVRVREELKDKEVAIAELRNEKISLIGESEKFEKAVEQLKSELKAATEQKLEAEGELLRECENIRSLRRELSDRTDRYDREKDSLVNSLSETRRENGVLKSANREIKEEYDKCLVENQRLVELISKRQSEAATRAGKENVDGDDVIRRRRADSKEKSPNRSPGTPVHEKAHRTSLNGPPTPSSLESEVESLRQVLALKTDEVTELRRQELSLRENADRVPKLLSTITMLEGKVEDLQTQLSSQTETVRDLFKSNDHLEEELKSANIQKTRLTHKNEELQYKLKQYAEAMKQLANQKNLSEKNIKSEFSPVRSISKKVEGNLDDSMKSQMKAVVEKSDSVSYMLEMTEDSSEIVTNIIRRAESLRSTNRDGTLPKKKRTKATSVSSVDADRNDRFKRNSSTEDDFRPDIMSTPNSSPCDYEFHAHMSARGDDPRSPAPEPPKYPVKLTQDDFSTDSIELPNDNDCEVIEITKNFDKIDKMLTSMSSSSSSSNGSHFDIESDVFSNLDNEQNINDLDEDTESSELHENGSVIRTYRREAENIKPVLPVYTDLDAGHSMGEDKPYLGSSKNLLKMPKVSGGEAMIGLSSDDEDIEKIKLCNE